MNFNTLTVNEGHDLDAIERPPRNIEYHLHRARSAIHSREFESARRNLIKALDLNPQSMQALNLVSVMLEMREEYQQVNSSSSIRACHPLLE